MKIQLSLSDDSLWSSHCCDARSLYCSIVSTDAHLSTIYLIPLAICAWLNHSYLFFLKHHYSCRKLKVSSRFIRQCIGYWNDQLSFINFLILLHICPLTSFYLGDTHNNLLFLLTKKLGSVYRTPSEIWICMIRSWWFLIKECDSNGHK